MPKAQVASYEEIDFLWHQLGSLQRPVSERNCNRPEEGAVLTCAENNKPVCLKYFGQKKVTYIRQGSEPGQWHVVAADESSEGAMPVKIEKTVANGNSELVITHSSAGELRGVLQGRKVVFTRRVIRRNAFPN